MKVAIILTAFNRREKTLNCLRNLFAIPAHDIEFKVYLTDDGSSDGTSQAVAEKFPQVILSHGDGSLFWAGGMNLSWHRAVKDGGYDGYLWLNDDTLLKDNIWIELKETDKWCRNRFGKGGIYVGSTLDSEGKRWTYGGSRCLHRWKSGYAPVPPTGDFQLCDIANGNVTYISANVVDSLGCLDPGYVHGGADYAYTFGAKKAGFPVILMRDYVGYCDRDHPSLREALTKRSLNERIRFLYSPTGMSLKTALLFQKQFYPHFLPVTFISYWTRALFPWILR